MNRQRKLAALQSPATPRGKTVEFRVQAQAQAPERRVLLAIKQDSLKERALSCAVNLCRRVNAGLDILLVSGEEELPARLTRFFGELNESGIGFRFVRSQGALGREITRYVRSCRNIAFVVVESLEDWGEGGRQAKPWRTLGCPLVVATGSRQGTEF